MNSSKNIYWIVILFILLGYVWVGFHFLNTNDYQIAFDACFIKNATGFPCVSCGITRSIIHVLHGDFYQAVMINPLGVIAAFMMLFTPFWICMDAVCHKQTLAKAIIKGEVLLKSYKVYLPLIVLGLLNWYWNIIKGL